MKRDKIELDQADRRLLSALQKDASVSQTDLAEKAGVSPSQISRKLTRLTQKNVLRIVGVIEPELAGLTCAAIIRVRLRDHAAANVRMFKELVARMNEVTLCVMTTGETDYLMKVVARDLPHFQEIVQSKLLRCAAIAHMESSIILEHLKDTTALPLDDA